MSRNTIKMTREIDGKYVSAHAEYNEAFDSWDITIYQHGRVQYSCTDPEPYTRIPAEIDEQLKL